jgi:hypothetical protein
MAEVGIDITANSPKPHDYDTAYAADVIITMGSGDACPVFPGKRYEDWKLDDPAGQASTPAARSATTSATGSTNSSPNSSPPRGRRRGYSSSGARIVVRTLGSLRPPPRVSRSSCLRRIPRRAGGAGAAATTNTPPAGVSSTVDTANESSRTSKGPVSACSPVISASLRPHA